MPCIYDNPICMNDLDTSAFAALFKEACGKCFGYPVEKPLSETESKLFSGKVFDQTGLVIGPKSIKNYSLYILNGAEGREENPSVATLDTLARYVLNAPYTDEIQRKAKESHYPYWYQYKDRFYRSQKTNPKKWLKVVFAVTFMAVVGFFLLNTLLPSSQHDAGKLEEDFNSLSDDSLQSRGWIVQSKDSIWWSRRTEKSGHISLFTLKGDNWPDSLNNPGIKNLLLRPIHADCFSVEAWLSDFIPGQNWQQAGILLMEDTSFTGKNIRLSIVYNNFFGGFEQKPEILIQAVGMQGKGSKPEEIVHESLFRIGNEPDSLVVSNLRRSALRIEKYGKRFRFLFTTSPIENGALKEVINREIMIEPKYVGLFAIKGQVDSTTVIPAYFNYFSYTPENCK